MNSGDKQNKCAIPHLRQDDDGFIEDPRCLIESILSSSRESFFFLTPLLEIHPHYSPKIEKILGASSLANKSFTDLLSNRIPEEAITQTREYLQFMFQEELDTDTLKELNPLEEVEFFYEDEWGLWTSSRHLSFTFQRLTMNGRITGLIGMIYDISEMKKLSLRIEEMEGHAQKQMEWLVNILHVEPDLLCEFFDGVKHEIQNMEKILKNSREFRKPYEILEQLFRSLYMIRGNAKLLNLEFFAELAGSFSHKIVEIKKIKGIDGSAFVPVVIQLGNMRKTLEEIETIFKRISHFHNRFRAKRSYESEMLVTSLKNLIDTLCRQLNKQIKFDYSGLDVLSFPYSLRHLVRDILFLLIRNTILYGIETVEERRTNNKQATATLTVSSYLSEKKLKLVLRHDGRIDRIERILHQMVYENQSDQNSSFVNSLSLTQLLFMPNISQENEEELLDGYFTDIELLKKKLKECGGRLKITFTSEEYCDYIIDLPLKNKSKSRNK